MSIDKYINLFFARNYQLITLDNLIKGKKSSNLDQKANFFFINTQVNILCLNLTQKLKVKKLKFYLIHVLLRNIV